MQVEARLQSDRDVGVDGGYDHEDDGRDGWDDLDVAMLGMDLGGSQPEVAAVGADDSADQPPAPESPAAADTRVAATSSSAPAESSCGSQPSEKPVRTEALLGLPHCALFRV